MSTSTLTVSDDLTHLGPRCFDSWIRDGQALKKLGERLSKKTPPRTIQELQPIATCFAESRIPVVRGPSSDPLSINTSLNKDDDGDAANDIRSVVLVSSSFKFLNAFSLGYPTKFVKLASFFVDIWPAMYKWLIFLSEDVLDPVTSPYRTIVNGIWPAAAFFIGELMCTHDTPFSDIISTTPGITCWAIRIWTQDIRLGWKTQSGRPYSLDAFIAGLLFYTDLPESDELAMAQMILDTAGGPKAMANSLLEHLNGKLSEFAQDPGLPFERIVAELSAPVHILAAMDLVALDGDESLPGFVADRHTTRVRRTTPLLAALLCQGLMTTLVNVMKHLTVQPPTSQSTDLFFLMYYWLTPCLFEIANAPCWICQALDAGLLLVLARSGPMLREARGTMYGNASSIASGTPMLLQSFLYYRSVLRSVSRGMRVVAEETTASERNAVSGWRSLCKVAEFHIEMKKVFDKHKEDGERVSDCERLGCFMERGCQNVKRCARCFAAFYCSKTCQVADWPTHKEVCKRRREMLSSGVHIPMSKNDKAFVVHLARAAVASTTVSGASGRALLVDFRRLPCEVKPMQTDDEAHRHGVDAEEWIELKRQARETGCIPWVAILVAPIGAPCYVRGLAPLPAPQAA